RAQVCDARRRRRGDQVATGRPGARGQPPFLLGAVPVARRDPAQELVEARRRLVGRGRLEQPAVLAPPGGAVRTGQDGFPRRGRAGRPAGGGRADLGQLGGVGFLKRVAGLAFGDDVALVGGGFLGRQVAALGGGAGQ